MSEKQKEITRKLIEAIENADELKENYICGFVDGLTAGNRNSDKAICLESKNGE